MFSRLKYGTAVSKELMHLLKIPIDVYQNLLTVLELKHFGPLFKYFDYHGRKTMSAFLINSALENDTKILTPEQVTIHSFSSLLLLLFAKIRKIPEKNHNRHFVCVCVIIVWHKTKK